MTRPIEEIAADPWSPWQRVAIDFLTKGLDKPTRAVVKGDVAGHEFHGNQWSGGAGVYRGAKDGVAHDLARSDAGPHLPAGHTGLNEQIHNGSAVVDAKLFSGEKNNGKTGWQGVERGTLDDDGKKAYDSARQSGSNHDAAMKAGGGETAFPRAGTSSQTVRDVHAAHGLST